MSTTHSWSRLAPLAILLLVAAVASQASPGAGSAVTNSVYLDPGDVTVGPGGTTVVKLTAEPPETSLSVWWVTVQFDPAVVSVDGCQPLSSPPGAFFASDCEVIGPNRVDSVGVVMFSDTEKGLEATTVLASITFRAEGVGQCSDLSVTVGAFLDPDQATTPQITSGRICVSSGGTSRVWGDVDCSGGTNAVSIADAQKIAMKLINIPPSQQPGCPQIGQVVTVQ